LGTYSLGASVFSVEKKNDKLGFLTSFKDEAFLYVIRRLNNSVDYWLGLQV
jgi:hypothetical protein